MEAHFHYPGIPLVGKGYQNAHIEGNRALLMFLPLNIKRTAIHKGALQFNFLSTAAALLGVPQRFEQLLTQKQLPVYQVWRSDPYMEAQFSTTYNLGIEQIARFLAWNGVPPDEAEQWHPWATAYIEIELIEHPNGIHAPALKQAKDLACKHILDNASLALSSVHVDMPGNYNLALEQSWEVRRQAASTIALIPQWSKTKSPSPIIFPSTPGHSYIAPMDNKEPVYFHSWDNEDNRMGLG